jgi:hypothetical protein
VSRRSVFLLVSMGIALLLAGGPSGRGAWADGIQRVPIACPPVPQPRPGDRWEERLRLYWDAYHGLLVVYNRQVAPLQAQETKLRVALAKARTPKQKANLRTRINGIDIQINSLTVALNQKIAALAAPYLSGR